MHNEAFEAMATEMVGDGGSPNMYFVSDDRGVFLITTDFDAAYVAWSQLPHTTEDGLEDRRTGTIASTQPETDEPFSPLRTYDDSSMRLQRRIRVHQHFRSRPGGPKRLKYVHVRAHDREV